ncbi:HTH-type transcriptional repressor of iron proteins A [Serratia grimesii]|jgi:AraC-like DNA-binding protein|uniref:AraC family transcriptional regulator n=1 Tax=Serratia grimesii TaxID=82995 RepID=UPI00217C03EE|nr:helix-turn-helix transcriptional regulator [Serratia grimesii]CAI1870847.1 HTH-type transcriptional repressor of iron proteins A [Serratia grimesii]
MALITQQAVFDPDAWLAPVLGIAAELVRHDSEDHVHQRAQLLYAPRGCMTVTLADRWLILPPTRSLWIPGGIRHRVQLRGQVAYRSIYLDPSLVPAMPQECAVLAVNPLLAAVVERIAYWPFNLAMECRTAQDLLPVLVNELHAARLENTGLMLPRDRRLAHWLEELDGCDELPGLAKLAQTLNLHAKTLTRIFQRESGLSYQQWSQQWRLMRAIELLAEMPSVSSVAQRLGFSSDSAFIAFFRQFTGTTPKRFMKGDEREETGVGTHAGGE